MYDAIVDERQQWLVLKQEKRFPRSQMPAVPI